jgi:WD40 repeat protein
VTHSLPASLCPSSALHYAVFNSAQGPGLRCQIQPQRYSCDPHAGQFVATGSDDMAVKLLSVELMTLHSDRNSDDSEAPSKPVLKTFYDHESAVHDLDFHPFLPHLISGSKDCTIKFYEYEKNGARRSFRFLQDTHSVNSVHFHPTGDYIVAGTEHHMIRIHDVNTFQCYTACIPEEHHTAAVNSVRFAPEASYFASGSLDGNVKIWVLLLLTTGLGQQPLREYIAEASRWPRSYFSGI